MQLKQKVGDFLWRPTKLGKICKISYKNIHIYGRINIERCNMKGGAFDEEMYCMCGVAVLAADGVRDRHKYTNCHNTYNWVRSLYLRPSAMLCKGTYLRKRCMQVLQSTTADRRFNLRYPYRKSYYGANPCYSQFGYCGKANSQGNNQAAVHPNGICGISMLCVRSRKCKWLLPLLWRQNVRITY